MPRLCIVGWRQTGARGAGNSGGWVCAGATAAVKRTRVCVRPATSTSHIRIRRPLIRRHPSGHVVSSLNANIEVRSRIFASPATIAQTADANSNTRSPAQQKDATGRDATDSLRMTDRGRPVAEIAHNLVGMATVALTVPYLGGRRRRSPLRCTTALREMPGEESSSPASGAQAAQPFQVSAEECT